MDPKPKKDCRNRYGSLINRKYGFQRIDKEVQKILWHHLNKKLEYFEVGSLKMPMFSSIVPLVPDTVSVRPEYEKTGNFQ